MSTFHVFNPFVWDPYCVPVLGAGETAVNKTECVPPWLLPPSGGDY